VEVVVPPLRARRQDIPLLVDHFLDVHGQATTMSIDRAALEALMERISRCCSRGDRLGQCWCAGQGL
jgi:transcriptional regulator with GAF, ATPase, and Fis domain